MSTNKIALIIAMSMTIIYMGLKLSGFDNFDLGYKVITVAAGVYAALSALTKAAKSGDKGIIFVGGLGLGLLAVSEIYYLAHILFAFKTEAEMDVGDLSDTAAALFFLAAILLLLLLPPRWEKTLRIWSGIFAVVVTLTITYSIVRNDFVMGSIAAMVMGGVITLLSVILIYQIQKIPQLEKAGCFAFAMLYFGVVDIVSYYFYSLGAVEIAQLLFALYMPAYIWINEGLARMDEARPERRGCDG